MKSIVGLLPQDMFGQIAVIMNGLMFAKAIRDLESFTSARPRWRPQLTPPLDAFQVPIFRLIRDKDDQARLAAAVWTHAEEGPRVARCRLL